MRSATRGLPCVLASGALAVGVWSAGAATARSDELPAALRACVGERQPERRLACFDREVGKLIAATEAATPGAAASMTPEQQFGYADTAAAKAAARKMKRSGTELTELRATVKALGRQPHGQWVVTLDNGQVWVQKSLDSRFVLEIGDAVTIKKAALGSFLLVGPGGGSTRVSRVR
ncbi:MAG: hypothetical protein NZM12_05410 [Steroidobacteraceae bacterium]|nr:hypothetical protein [Steroidobacteraceae bacterium]MDW8260818.1 hypothetical protein [Gammaproteobacteria bacterium]